MVKVRGEAMQQASEEVPSGMMTVFLRPESKLKFACHTARRYCSERLNIEDPVCQIANFLYPECKVVAGHEEVSHFLLTHWGLVMPYADIGIVQQLWLR